MKNLASAALFVGGIAIGWVIALYVVHPPGSSADSAAWVQAVGSIIAIGGAFGAVLVQNRLSFTASKRAKDEESAVVVAAFLSVAIHVDSMLKYVVRNFETAESARDFLKTWTPTVLLTEKSRIDAFPIHRLPTAERVEQAVSLSGWIAGVLDFTDSIRHRMEGTGIEDWNPVKAHCIQVGASIGLLMQTIQTQNSGE